MKIICIYQELVMKPTEHKPSKGRYLHALCPQQTTVVSQSQWTQDRSCCGSVSGLNEMKPRGDDAAPAAAEGEVSLL